MPVEGYKRDPKLVDCGCGDEEVWYLVDQQVSGLALAQCSVCKRMIGIAVMVKQPIQRPAIIVPGQGGRLN